MHGALGVGGLHSNSLDYFSTKAFQIYTLIRRTLRIHTLFHEGRIHLFCAFFIFIFIFYFFMGIQGFESYSYSSLNTSSFA
jgi:hypothetical protein